MITCGRIKKNSRILLILLLFSEGKTNIIFHQTIANFKISSRINSTLHSRMCDSDKGPMQILEFRSEPPRNSANI